MSTIVIASKANSLYLAECEVLAEFLAKNLPNFKYSVIKKHKNEWDSFLTSLVETYGFKRKCCPIVFTVEGELIGDVSEFYDYSQAKFGKVYRVSKDTLNLRAKHNARMVNEEVRRRDKGPNIIEKIQKSLRKAKKKHLVKNYEGFFKNVIVDGIPFRVRLTDLAKRSIEFRDEIDPGEGLGDADLEQDELEQERREHREGEENEGESPTIKNNYEEKEEFEINPEQNENEVHHPEGEGHHEMHLDDYHGEGDAEYDEREEEEEEIEKEEPEILPEFPFDPSKGMNYNDFVAFYQEEIEGRLNRREAIAAKLKQNKPEEEEELNQKRPNNEGEGEEGGDGEGEGKDDTHVENKRSKEEERKMEEDNQRQKELEEQEMLRRRKEREDFYELVKNERYFLDEKFHRVIISK